MRNINNSARSMLHAVYGGYGASVCNSCCNLGVVSCFVSIGFSLLSFLHAPIVWALPPSQASLPCVQCFAKPGTCQRSELSNCPRYNARSWCSSRCSFIYVSRCERYQNVIPGPCRWLDFPALLLWRLGAAAGACQHFSGRPPQLPGLVCSAWRSQRRQCLHQVQLGQAAAPACLEGCTKRAAAGRHPMVALLSCNLVGFSDTEGALIRSIPERSKKALPLSTL